MSSASEEYPFEAIASKKYKSPHKNDLSFAKGERIRVLRQAPKDEEDDEDEDDDDVWLIGENLDGSKTGSFPASHVERVEAAADEVTPAAIAVPPQQSPPTPVDAKPSEATVEQTEQATEPEAAEAAIEPQPSTAPVAIPSQPDAGGMKIASKPSSPPLAPKPSGLAARIAAFNKPQDSAPPPLPRGKPGGWKPPPPAPGAPKPVMPGMSAAQLNRSVASRSSTLQSGSGTAEAPVEGTSPVSSSVSDSQQDKISSGFSAADAQSSIKMSLKERMAALQAGGGASGSGEKRSAPAKPATKPPGKIDEERRAAALAHLGSNAEAEEGADIESALQSDATEPTAEEKEVEQESTPAESEKVVDVEDAAASNDEPVLANPDQEEEKSEEQLESERRAAIAARMAKLGGRRMGAGPGPAMFGAPAPVVSSSRQASADDRQAVEMPEVRTEAAEKDTVDPPAQSGAEEAGEAKQGETLAVPRRTAPPRRKKASSASSSQAPAPEIKQEGNKDAAVGASSGDTDAVLKEDPPEETIGHHGSGTVLGGDAANLTAEPEEQEGGGVAEGAGATKEQDGADVNDDDEDFEMIEAPSISRKPTDASTATRDSVSAGFAPSTANDTDNFEPGTPVSHTELEEHARQLEAFVRTPDEAGLQEDADTYDDRTVRSSGQVQPEEGEDAEEGTLSRAAVSSPPPPSFAPPPRPPSGRPPVPKTPTPAVPAETDVDEDEGQRRITSPPPTRAPPVPVTSLGSTVAQAQDAKEEEAEEIDPAIESSEAPTLAAPKPRMAIPLDDAELDEEEGHEEAAQLPTTTTSATTDPPAAPAPESVQPEEEDERQRRRRLAERMARMGAQPIMGAPMPFRNKSVVRDEEPEQEEQEREDAEDDAEDTDEAAVEEEAAQEPRLERLEHVDAPAPIASPPPIPTKSPAPPIRSPDAARRGSQVLMAADLARSGSTRARPPVPSVAHSRQGTLDEDEQPSASIDDQLRAASPPVLPSSPPPLPPSRAPPGRQASISSSNEGSTARRQGSSASVSNRTSRLIGVQSSGPSPRDLDLMPSSQWWRHGRPVRLPPSLMRPDAVRFVSTEDDGAHHLIRVDLVFEDYSSTNITVLYQDDDAPEEHTQTAQRHNFAPARPTGQQLTAWSQQLGVRVARSAAALLGGGGGKAGSAPALGDGTSRGFVAALIDMSTNGECLPAVGNCFGALLLAQAGTTTVEQGADEVRAGDVVAMHGADFKGKRGLSSYHATYGTANEPAFACIIEVASDVKKRKLRCALIPTSNGGKSGRGAGGPEEVSLRLDDVKNGLLRVYRVVPRTGWLPN